jgi:hypothetical protein
MSRQRRDGSKAKTRAAESAELNLDQHWRRDCQLSLLSVLVAPSQLTPAANHDLGITNTTSPADSGHDQALHRHNRHLQQTGVQLLDASGGVPREGVEYPVVGWHRS